MPGFWALGFRAPQSLYVLFYKVFGLGVGAYVSERRFEGVGSLSPTP